MRTVLTIGAVICCLIGLFVSIEVIGVIVMHWGWSDLLTYLRYPDTYLASLYAGVAFIPMVFVIRSKRIDNAAFRFALIGIIEFMVVFMFLLICLVKV